MPPTRNRSTRRSNPSNHHPYANPTDQFEMAFGAVAINQQAQQAPGGDNHDHEDDGNDGSSNNNFASNPNNNDSNTNDAGRRLAQFRENFNAENIRKYLMIRLMFRR